MKTIYKYTVPVKRNFFDLAMPLGAEILATQVQNGTPVMWALLNPDNEPVVRHFEVVGTGENLDEKAADTSKYIGTIQMPPFVWHLFETKE